MDAQLLVLVPLTSCCFALCAIFALAYVNFGRRKYALSWSLAFGCIGLAYSQRFLPPFFSSPDWRWVFSAFLSCTSVTLGLRGHLQRVERPAGMRYLSLGVLTFGVSVWTTLVAPHFGLRIASLPLHAAVVNAFAAWIVISSRPRTLLVEWCLAVSLALFALSQLAAGLVALSQGATQDPQLMEMYFNLNFLAMPACFLAMGMFSVLILANDLAEEMRELATVDALTGLTNRRGMNDALKRAWAMASRSDSSLSLLLADLDDFKKVNDTYGHDIGDQVLQAIAKRLDEQGRTGDIVARWGGEEFLLLLENTDAETANIIADRIDEDLTDSPVSTTAGPLTISASIGSATADTRTDTVEELIQRADTAMYEQKVARRERCAQTPESGPLDTALQTV